MPETLFLTVMHVDNGALSALPPYDVVLGVSLDLDSAIELAARRLTTWELYESYTLARLAEMLQTELETLPVNEHSSAHYSNLVTAIWRSKWFEFIETKPFTG